MFKSPTQEGVRIPLDQMGSGARVGTIPHTGPNGFREGRGRRPVPRGQCKVAALRTHGLKPYLNTKSSSEKLRMKV